MMNLFDLPAEVLDIIFKNLSASDLFDLITKQTSPAQVINSSIQTNENTHKGSLKKFYKMLRLELFNRRDAKAVYYQNILLKSWLKHWSIANRLSFIENNQDKKEWLMVLDAALKDQQSSFEHKIRCCLFINKLFPGSQDFLPLIIQSILRDISWRSYAKSNISRIMVFSSEFSQDHMQKIIISLLKHLNHNRRDDQRAAMTALGALSPHLAEPQRILALSSLTTKLHDEDNWDLHEAKTSTTRALVFYSTKPQRDEIITAALNKLSNDDAAVRMTGLTTIDSLAPHVSQYDEVIIAVLDKLNDDDIGVRMVELTTLGSLAPHATKAQCDTMIDPILAQLNNAGAYRYHIIMILGALAPYVSEPQCNSMINPVLTHFHTINWLLFNAKDAATTIGTLASLVSKTRCDEMIDLLLPKLLPKLNDALSFCERRKRNATAEALGAIMPHASNQYGTVITALLMKANDDDSEVRQSMVTAMGAVAPSAPDDLHDLMISCLLTKLNDNRSCVREGAAKALITLAPRASKFHHDEMIASLAAKLNHDDFMPQTAARALIALAPHASKTQRHAITSAIINNLSHMRAAFDILVELIPYVTEDLYDPMISFLHPELNAEKWYDRSNAAEVLGAIGPYASIMHRDVITSLLINKLTDEDENVREAATLALASLAPSLSEDQLKQLRDTVSRPSPENAILHLVMQTLLYIPKCNHSEMTRGTQCGTYFSLENNATISQGELNSNSNNKTLWKRHTI